jgi:hypothetical protein
VLVLQPCSHRFQRIVALVARRQEGLGVDCGTSAVQDVVDVEELPWTVERAGVRTTVTIPRIRRPVAGRLLLAERHPVFERRAVNNAVGNRPLRERNWLERALDVEDLQRPLADPNVQAAILRLPGEQRVRRER